MKGEGRAESKGSQSRTESRVEEKAKSKVKQSRREGRVDLASRPTINARG